MAVPAAIVTITLQQLNGIEPGLLDGTERPYAIARVGQRQLGRSRVIPPRAGSFNLSLEPSPWRHEMAVAAGESILIEIELWDDRGDDATRFITTIRGTIGPPWQPRQYTFGGSPSLQCEITTRPVPGSNQPVFLPRVVEAANRPTRATIRLLPAVIVELTEIQGLYEPGYRGSGAVHPRLAEYHAGYTSQDDKGRIYLNRDLRGSWSRNTQSIQLSAQLRVLGGRLPADARLRWLVSDPDDSSNEARHVHRDSGMDLDGNDYQSLGNELSPDDWVHIDGANNTAGQPLGFRGGDNEGRADRDPVWEQVAQYGLTVDSNRQARTAIIANQSSVKLHCPNVAGDNLTVRVEVETSSTRDVYAAQTGIMTMWNRLDVEYLQMQSAFPLPVSEVPRYFESAYVQLDFSRPRIIPDRAYLAPDFRRLSLLSSRFVNSVFNHRNSPGWFCLVAALEGFSPPANSGPSLAYEGPVELHVQRTRSGIPIQYVDIPGSQPDADLVRFSWRGDTLMFEVRRTGLFVDAASGRQMTRCFLSAHDIQNRFTAGDGSLSHAYHHRLLFYPRGRVEVDGQHASDARGGYGMPTNMMVEVSNPGELFELGISPPVTRNHRRYFAGRTIIFTQAPDYLDPTPNPSSSAGNANRPADDFNDNVKRSIVHELVHAFGMPHKCGFWDHRTPREFTCCMNYNRHWIVDHNEQVIPNTAHRSGDEMCSRHLKEVRRTHLEDNDGLQW